MFVPGETIMHNFVIPFIRTDITKAIVTYKQDDHIVLEIPVTSFLEYRGPDGKVDPAKCLLKVNLSQEESLLFNDLKDYSIQLNIYTEGNTRHASAVIKNVNGPQYHREVM